jgi:hypothetical protein
MLTTLDVFKAATNIKIDPDKPLQAARLAALKVSFTVPLACQTSFFSCESSSPEV